MHRHPVRVYYEDTDAGGIVYHANYLKFAERARSEWVRALGLDQKRLREERGLIIVVRRMEVDFLRPALYDDLLEVTTTLRGLGGARIELDQAVLRGDEKLFAAVVTLVCVGTDGRAARLPEDLRTLLSG
ncbi:tol-pal system-associated acyl-CoA thioesterase [Gemmobacter aquaticus]|jgi:acyl-CoA thioester hydrolase|uniref:Tol-pal system-associated acyl-CoA thioesterase n=1 Tax=Gemmobacter aquaticus TaxID=490185 RepID=A0A918DCA2_9RHOB|nr:tol-pal system-associated acyl-CoA thioesterase [Gemmobacter aquaticus]GGO31100.1 tol-pal system-associated acyl-CoA thioesterase [Gemmobacter aquaticus]